MSTGTDELLQRRLTIVVGGLLVLFCVLCLTALVDDRFGEFVDAAIYLLAAQSLSVGEGYRFLDQPFFSRPPGVSFLLLPFLGDPIDHGRLNLVLQITAVLAFGAVAWAMRRLHGALLGLLVALLFAVNRFTLQSFNKLFSEFPFMALFYAGAVLLMAGRDGRQASWRRALPGAVLVSISLYFRSVGLLLLPGLVVCDLFRKDGRRWQGAVLALGIVALHLPWMIWSGRAADAAPRPSTQLLVFDYGTALFHEDPRDPDSPTVDIDGWLERVRVNTGDLVEAVGDMFLGIDEGPVPTILTILVGLAMLHTWFVRRSLLDWFMPCYVALLLLYFTFAGRLLIPLVPMMLSSLVFSGRRLGERVVAGEGKQRAGLIAAGVIALVLIGAGAPHVGSDIAPSATKAYNRKVDGAVVEWLKRNTPENAVIMHERGPILSVLSGRRVYTYRNLPGGWPHRAPAVDWIILGPFTSPIEEAVEAASLRRRSITVKYLGQQAVVRMYKMR